MYDSYIHVCCAVSIIGIFQNTMAVDMHKHVYKMNHLSRGLAIIINNTKFHPSTRMPDRGGSDKDAIHMHELFETYSFDTRIYHNQTTTEIMSIMKKGTFFVCQRQCFLFVKQSLSHPCIFYPFNLMSLYSIAQLSLLSQYNKHLVYLPHHFVHNLCQDSQSFHP